MNPIVAIAAALCCISTLAAVAQPGNEKTQLSQRPEVVKNCRLGRYLGEGNGLPIYFKTGFEWRVSPEFAKDRCFPESTIQEGMKGILAIGYRSTETIGYPVCHTDGSLCFTPQVHRFDILLPEKTLRNESGIKHYYAPPVNPMFSLEQAMLISKSIMIDTPSPSPVGPVYVSGTNRQRAKFSLSDAHVILYSSQVLEGVEMLSIYIRPGFFAEHAQNRVRVSSLTFKTLTSAANLSGGLRPRDEDLFHINVPEGILKMVRDADLNMATENQQAAAAIVNSLTKQ